MSVNLLTGTRQWCDKGGENNSVDGCRHACRYCYGFGMKAGLYGGKLGISPAAWLQERINPAMTKRAMRQRRIIKNELYPSTHDITPPLIDHHIKVITSILPQCKRLLVVSKPHLVCVQAICKACRSFQDRLIFRFTIGSADDSVLRYWEPGAPPYTERLESLEYAFREGFQTSVSGEPMVDGNIEQVILDCQPFVTHSFWIGKANNLRKWLAVTGQNSPTIVQAADTLIASQNDQRIEQLHQKYGAADLVKYKDSVR